MSIHGYVAAVLLVVGATAFGLSKSETGSHAGFDIKGNISYLGEKIYHVPGQKYSAATIIRPSAGERWFCSESEALAEGWRKSHV